MRKKGFTLIEILGVIVVLAVIAAIAIPIYNNVTDNSKEKAFENKSRQIELAAERWASAMNLSNNKVITVNRLVEEGYLLADSYDDELPILKNPVDNESMLCYTITITLENGSQVAKLNPASEANCSLAEEEGDERYITVTAFRIDGDKNIIDTNPIGISDKGLNVLEWTATDVVLIVESTKWEFSKVFWSEGGHSTSTDVTATPLTPDDITSARISNVQNPDTYGNIFIVEASIFLNSEYEIGILAEGEGVKNTSTTVRIDKESPLIEARTGTEWIKGPKREVSLNGSDGEGSGLHAFNVEGTIYETESLNSLKVDLANNSDGSPKTYEITSIDKVGNVSKPVKITIKNIDSKGAESISLTPSTTEQAASVDLTGKAQDTQSGLVAYQFTTSSSIPTSGWEEIDITNAEITKKLEGVNRNATYYFWVKDALGNTSYASYEVDNIDSEGAEEISLTPNTTAIATSVNLTGKAIDTISGLVAYQFNQSATVPTTGWITITKTYTETTQSKNGITSNGTWYFWVKDALGNTSYASYTITNIDKEGAESISLTPNTTAKTNSVNLTGKAQDTLSGLVAYQFNQSSTVPTTGWTPITKTNNQIIQYRNNITSNGTWYFWVKDALGNTSKKAYTISNIHKNPTVTSVTVTNATESGFTVNAKASAGSSSLKTYYFSTNGGSTWTTVTSSSTSASKTFTGLAENTTYSIAVKVMDTSNFYSTIYYTSGKTISSSFASYLKSTDDPDLVPDGDQYDYTGSNPDNFVCFGSTASSCPEKYLYRVIHVKGDQVKLVKYSLFDIRYTWANKSNNNLWTDSPLNDYLNSDYLSSLGSTWRNMIATTTWTIRDGALYDAKIGLLYAAEAEKGKPWILPPYYDDIYDSEVAMYEHSTDGANVDDEINGRIHEEWLLDVYNVQYVYRFTEDGTVWRQKRAHCVPLPDTTFCRKRYFRSTFYLTAEVKRTSGSGTISDPYRISL